MQQNATLVAALFVLAGIFKSYTPPGWARWIPLGLLMIGAALYLWRAGWVITPETLQSAIIVGAAATGLHQVGRQSLKGG